MPVRPFAGVVDIDNSGLSARSKTILKRAQETDDRKESLVEGNRYSGAKQSRSGRSQLPETRDA